MAQNPFYSTHLRTKWEQLRIIPSTDNDIQWDQDSTVQQQTNDANITATVQTNSTTEQQNGTDKSTARYHTPSLPRQIIQTPNTRSHGSQILQNHDQQHIHHTTMHQPVPHVFVQFPGEVFLASNNIALETTSPISPQIHDSPTFNETYQRTSSHVSNDDLSTPLLFHNNLLQQLIDSRTDEQPYSQSQSTRRNCPSSTAPIPHVHKTNGGPNHAFDFTIDTTSVNFLDNNNCGHSFDTVNAATKCSLLEQNIGNSKAQHFDSSIRRTNSTPASTNRNIQTQTDFAYLQSRTENDTEIKIPTTVNGTLFRKKLKSFFARLCRGKKTE